MSEVIEENMKDYSKRDLINQLSLRKNEEFFTSCKWWTSPSYKRCMVAVFIFLIMLFLFRYPIIRWLSTPGDDFSPIIDLPACEPADGLRIQFISLAPSEIPHEVIVTFSTNKMAGELIAVLYGPNNEVTEYEAFSSHQLMDKLADFPHLYSSRLALHRINRQHVYFKIKCGSVETQMYKFYPWSIGNMWHPEISIRPAGIDGLSSDNTDSLNILYITNNTDVRKLANSSIISQQEVIPSILLSDTDQQYYRSVYPMPAAEWPSDSAIHKLNIGLIELILYTPTSDLKSDLLLLRQHITVSKSQRLQSYWKILVVKKYGFADWHRLLTEDLTVFNLIVFIDSPQPKTVTRFSENKGGMEFISIGSDLGRLSNLPPVIANKTIAGFSDLQIKMSGARHMCISVNTANHLQLDHFCMRKNLDFSSLVNDSHFDFTAWLTMVIIVGVIIVTALLFRNKLYSKLCIYFKKDGGAPLYYGKFMAV